MKLICSLLTIFFAFNTSATEQSVISLKPGYWIHSQKTSVQELPFPATDFTESECLLESQSKKSLEHYIAQFKRGLGEGANCRISNLVHNHKTVSFNLYCTEEGGITSDNQIEYKYSDTRVDVLSSGVITVMGKKFANEIKSISEWKRLCTKEEQRVAEEKQKIHTEKEESNVALLEQDVNSQYLKPVPASTLIPKPITKSQPILRLQGKSFYKEFKKIKTDKPILVHFSSTDVNCSHCLKSNKVFSDMHKQHGENYTFVEVIFNPWKSYQKRFKRIKGLPTTNLYLDKIEMASIVGHQRKLPRLVEDKHRWLNQVLNADYSNDSIPQISADDLDGLVNRKNDKKLLFINISSSSPECVACDKHNRLIRYGAKQLADKVTFAELIYNPHKAVKNDAALMAFLKRKKAKLNGMPVTLIFNKGKLLGARPGVWPAIVEDTDKILKRLR